jgi:hypothetical protein
MTSSSCLTYLGMAIAVEVWHIPSVLLVIVVVGVGRVVGGGDRLGVGSRRTVVEVHATEKLRCFIFFIKTNFPVG